MIGNKSEVVLVECRYTHDNSDADVDGFRLKVFDGVNQLSRYVTVHPSTMLETPATVNLVEGGRVVLLMENLIAGHSGNADGKTYSFDVVVAPVDVAVVVGGKELQTFTDAQVQLQRLTTITVS